MSKLYPNTVIAQRLGISSRQVSRILARYGAGKEDPARRQRGMDRETEDVAMAFSRAHFGDSYGTIARRHGLTRQAVHQRLMSNE